MDAEFDLSAWRRSITQQPRAEGTPGGKESRSMPRWTGKGKNPDGTGSAKCQPGCECGKHKFGRAHKNWTESPTVSAIHQRLNTHTPAKERDCVDCGGQAFDWSRTHDTSGTEESHYNPRCRGCHMKYDARFRWEKPRG